MTATAWFSRTIRALALGSLCLVLGAQTAAAQGVVSGLSATDLFAAAERARAAGLPDQALILYEALTHDPDPQVRAEGRFRKAMLLAERGDYVRAAATFRALLDEKPDATRVRLELARVLAAMGRDRDAARALRQAQAGPLPPGVSLVVDQFANALRSNQRFGGSLELALAPDSNVNRATSARTLDTIIAPLTLSDDARARSGLGLKASAQLYARWRVNRELAVVPRLSGAGAFYRASTFDDASTSALVGLEWAHARYRLTPSVGRTWRWYGGQPYAHTTVAALDSTLALDRRTQLSISLNDSAVRYQSNPLQDGPLLDATATFERATSARGGAGASLSLTRLAARDAGYATRSASASLYVWRDIGRSTVLVSGRVGRLQGDEPLFLFPDRRREQLSQLSTSVTLRRLTVAAFAPLVRVGVERNHSNIALYDYRRVFADFGVVRAF